MYELNLIKVKEGKIDLNNKDIQNSKEEKQDNSEENYLFAALQTVVSNIDLSQVQTTLQSISANILSNNEMNSYIESVTQSLFSATSASVFQISTRSYKNILNVISESLIFLPEMLGELDKSAAKKMSCAKIWGNYGWVVFLPKLTLVKIKQILINCPSSQEEADSIMVSQLSDENLQSIIKYTQEKIKQFNGNTSVYDEAVQCYEMQMYSTCCLGLFALIDFCFIVHQPIQGKGRRKLAWKAVDMAMDDKRMDLFCTVVSVKEIISNLFQDGVDFTKENGLNRNFSSHGMNKYQPTKIDCLKLFVLLYNICHLFSSKYLQFETKQTVTKEINV